MPNECSTYRHKINADADRGYRTPCVSERTRVWQGNQINRNQMAYSTMLTCNRYSLHMPSHVFVYSCVNFFPRERFIFGLHIKNLKEKKINSNGAHRLALKFQMYCDHFGLNIIKRSTHLTCGEYSVRNVCERDNVLESRWASGYELHDSQRGGERKRKLMMIVLLFSHSILIAICDKSVSRSAISHLGLRT